MSRITNCLVKPVARVQAIRLGNEEGQGLAEYGLILALIAVVCIGALEALGTGVAAKLNSVVAAL